MPRSFDKSVRLVLATLREGGPDGIPKSALRAALEAAALESDPTLAPVTGEDQQHWDRALDKQVERCLRRLLAQGAGIGRRLDSGGQAWFTLEHGPDWDEHITSEARLALNLAAMTLSHSGTDLWQEKLGLIEGLASRHMSNRDRALFTQLAGAVRVYGGVEDSCWDGTEILEPLLKAIHTRCLVKLGYQKAGASQATSLTLAPQALTHDIFSGGAYLLAWDPRSRTPRQYRLNRVSSVELLEEPAVINHPEKLQRALDYQIGAWASGDQPFEVVARISGTRWVHSIQEAPPAFRDFGSELEKGGRTLLVRFKANLPQGPMRWLQQFGSCALVLEPGSLRERIRDDLKAALAAYES